MREPTDYRAGGEGLTFASVSPMLFAVAENDPRQKNALLIAASLIAAVRTAREEEIKPNSPRIICKVDDSVRLAQMVLKRIERDE
jgi:hypothetical protein